jgi:membrane fusion protein (multidrug efflux system)
MPRTSATPRRKVSLPAPLSPLLLAALLSSCGGDPDSAAGGPPGGRGRGPGGGSGAPGQASIPVAVAEVEIGSASSYYTSTAVLEAESHAQILARTTGVVREILREEGDRVDAGQILLRLEDDEARHRTRQAEANLRTARAEHERRARMLESGLLSEEEFGTTENTLSVREAELELANLDVSYTRVRAPFHGKVVRRLVDLGANVNPGTPLFEVMDVEPLLARVHIPAKRMGFVDVGQAMEISLESTGAVLTGKVSLVSPIVDPATGTVKVTAEVHDYPPETRPGDFAQARIVTDRHKQTKLVPSTAVFEEQGQSVLYVVEENRAVRRVVETGFIDGERTEVVSGLTPDELVVVKGQRQLRDGIGVEILEGPPHVLAALAEAESESLSADASNGEERDTAEADGGPPGQGKRRGGRKRGT